MSDIVARLEASLELPDLPDAARQNARDLFESLSRPVTVAVLGGAGSGKSAIINLFLKERLLPEGMSANFVEIIPGPEFMAEVSYSDGRLEAADQNELNEVQGADRVNIASPNPVLEDMVLIEASGCGSTNALALAIDDAAARADVVLWCTHKFSEEERVLWERVDERLRDNAFLVLTKADKLARSRKLAGALADLRGVAETEFAGLMPVATLQALKALESEPFDEDLWAGSGADGLLSKVTDRVRFGRQADLDQAELFLARYATLSEEAQSLKGRRTSQVHSPGPRRQRSRMTRQVVEALRNEAVEPNTVDEKDAPKAEDVAAVKTSPSPDPLANRAPDAPKKARVTTKVLDEPTPTPTPTPTEVAVPVAKVEDSPQGRITSASLADRLNAKRKEPSKPVVQETTAAGTGLVEIDKAAKALARLAEDSEKVLHLCTDTADTLQNIFESNALPSELFVLRDDVLQTCEHMTLLQLENTTGSAADAVSLLLQLRRDFQAVQIA